MTSFETSVNGVSGRTLVVAGTAAAATYSLRGVRLGTIVDGSVVEHLAALPLWLLDWAADMAMGGLFKSLLHRWCVATMPMLSAAAPEASGQDSAARVALATAKAGGVLSATPVDGLKTLHDLAEHAFAKYASWQCTGTRTLLELRPNPKGPPTKVFDNATNWRTYAQVQSRSADFGWGLRACGLVPQPDPDQGLEGVHRLDHQASSGFDAVAGNSCVCLYENTCADWLCCCLGAFSQSLVATTVYATLGVGSVVDAVNEGNLKVVFCNRVTVPEFLKRREDMPTLTHLIVSDDSVPAADCQAPLPSSANNNNSNKGLTILTVEEVLSIGQQFGAKATEGPVPPKPASVAVVMYTSGSTGQPKGVVIEHRQLLATVAGVRQQGAYYNTSGKESLQDCVLCYLPLAHIFELANELVALSCGCKLGYACPKSLSSDLAVPCGGFETFRPTFMVAVPKVLDVLRKGLLAKVKAAPSKAKRLLFDAALAARENSKNQGRASPLFDALIFKKVRAALGGRLRVIVTGGAPLNGETQAFVETCFGASVHPGFGLTETCGIVSANAFESGRLKGSCGPPVSTCNVRLVSCPNLCDANGRPYLASDVLDEKGTQCWGRGEVVVSGTNLASRYFKQPAITAEAFGVGPNKQREFSTGDIGCWRRDGSLAIVDRKKNLVKLSGGEYVALEFAEMVFGNCDCVDAVAGGVMVYADGTMDKPVALLQVNEPALLAWWATTQSSSSSPSPLQSSAETLLSNPEAEAWVLAQLNAEGLKQGLGRNCVLGAVRLLMDPWTPANGCLTATNKVQRRTIQAAHADFLEGLIKTQQLSA